MGKALGGAMGGYTTGPKPVIDLLRQRSRPYLFSNSLAPAVVGSSMKVIGIRFNNCLLRKLLIASSNVKIYVTFLDMLTESSHYAESLLAKVKRFRSKMSSAGFSVVGNGEHPICPVMLGDARYSVHLKWFTITDKMLFYDFRLASQFAEMMLEKGIYVIGFSFPVVPKGKARIRVQISAAHSDKDIDTCIDAFVSVGKQLKVI